MLAEDDPDDAAFELDEESVGIIANALTEKFGHRAALYAVRQIGHASSASIRTWLSIYQRLVKAEPDY